MKTQTPALESLELSDAMYEILPDGVIQALKRLSMLQRLSLIYCRCNNDFLSDLLETLALKNNVGKDKQYQPFTHLQVCGCSINESVMNACIQIQSLESLAIGKTTKTLIHGVAKIPQLGELTLYETKVCLEDL